MKRKTPEEITDLIYKNILKSEEGGWSDLDDNLEFYDYLTDKEVFVEASIKRRSHIKTGIRCDTEHEQKECNAPMFLEMVTYLLKRFEDSEFLSERDRYLLLNYLAMSEMGILRSV